MKYRYAALPIASVGASLGMFIFPPLVHYLDNKYGWRGATLLTGGILLHHFVANSLFITFEDENSETIKSSSTEKYMPLFKTFSVLKHQGVILLQCMLKH